MLGLELAPLVLESSKRGQRAVGVAVTVTRQVAVPATLIL